MNQNAAFPYLNPNLDLDSRVQNLLDLLTPLEKCGLMTSGQLAVARLGIKEQEIGLEIARGHVSRHKESPSTVFPQPIGMSAMFDPQLMEKIGHAAATESRIISQKAAKEKGTSPTAELLTFGPTVDMERHPLWGRNEEAYGEDPYLTGKMASAYTRGLRGPHPFYVMLAAGLKHFYANNNELLRDSSDSQIPPRLKHEYYLEPFRRIFKEGGAMGIMTAYNEINGIPALCNPEVKKIVKGEWGAEFVMSDGGDFLGNVIHHQAYPDHASSYAAALHAGADLMLDDNKIVTAGILAALEKGLITMSEFDEAVANVLRVRFKLGEFDPDSVNPYANMDESLLMCDEYTKLNLKAAQKQMVLLKNDDLLPLDAKKGSIAFIGPMADWNTMDWYTGYSAYGTTIKEGAKKYWQDTQILFDDGYDHVTLHSCMDGKNVSADAQGNLYVGQDAACAFEYGDWGYDVGHYRLLNNGLYMHHDEDDLLRANRDTKLEWFVKTSFTEKQTPSRLAIKTWNGGLVAAMPDGSVKAIYDAPDTLNAARFEKKIVSSGIARARQLAQKADTVVVCLGNDPMINGRETQDRPGLALPPKQRALLEAVCRENKNVLLLIVSSYPYAIAEEAQWCKAVMYSSHAGPELGNAVADTLAGLNNPAGRLPQTWYASDSELPSIMDYDIASRGITYRYCPYRPLYPFGFGLSYSHFEYKNASFNLEDKGIRISVDVQNQSAIAGEEVVQVYWRALHSAISRPLRQLCAFERRQIAPDGTERFSFLVPFDEMVYWNVWEERFVLEAGAYELMIGSDSMDIKAREILDIAGEEKRYYSLKEKHQAALYEKAEHLKQKTDIHTLQTHIQAEEGARVIYTTVDLTGAASFCMEAAQPGSLGNVSVLADGQLIAQGTIPPISDALGFKEYTFELKTTLTVERLELHLPQNLRVRSIYIK